MKNKIIKLSSIIIFILLIIGFIISYNNVNKNNPGYTYHYYDIEQKFDLENMKITVSDIKKYSNGEYSSTYKIPEEENEYKITVNIEFENNTDEIQIADLTRVLIEKKGWFSNMNLYDFYSINNLETCYLEIKPNSTQKVIVPFSYHYNSDKPISLSEIDFWLDIYTCYPNKNIVKI